MSTCTNTHTNQHTHCVHPHPQLHIHETTLCLPLALLEHNDYATREEVEHTDFTSKPVSLDKYNFEEAAEIADTMSISRLKELVLCEVLGPISSAAAHTYGNLKL